MMRQMGSANWAIVDKDEDLTFGSGLSDNGSVFLQLIAAAKEDVSIKICGASLGQDTLHGNRSKEESSLELLEAKCLADRRTVERRMNAIILPALAAQGFIPAGLHFAFGGEEDKEGLWTRTISLLPYYNVDEDWLRNTFGVEVTEAKSAFPTQGLSARLSHKQQEDDDPFV